jgi:hypothetical protein
MVCMGTMATSEIPTMMNGDALAAMKDLDHVSSSADIHLLTNERMRDRVEEGLDLDVIVRRHTGEAPLGILPISLG